MELRITRTNGSEDVETATREAIEGTLRQIGDEVQFLILEDGERYMQDDGVSLECGDNREGGLLLMRADAGRVREHGSLPAFLAFPSGDETLPAAYRWTDVTQEVPTLARWRLQVAGWVVLVAAVIALIIWRLL